MVADDLFNDRGCSLLTHFLFFMSFVNSFGRFGKRIIVVKSYRDRNNPGLILRCSYFFHCMLSNVHCSDYFLLI